MNILSTRTFNLSNYRNYRLRLGYHRVHAVAEPMINSKYAENDWHNVIFADQKVLKVGVFSILYWISLNQPRAISFQNKVQYLIVIFGSIWYNNRSN